MTKRKYLQALLLSLIGLATSAQDHVTSYEVDLQQRTPQSPNAGSLGKYLDFQVNMATGVPNIQIPIYSIRSGNITIPIVLSYHAGGVKVNEKAGWVGLGWTLNPGGSIVKKTNGLDDIYLTSGTGSVTPFQDYLHPDYTYIAYNPGYTNMTNAVEGFIANQWPEVTLDSNMRFMGQILIGRNDGEADDFFYTTPNGSGKFYYNQVLSGFQVNNVNGYVVSGDTTGWVLTGKNGVGYLFGQREHTLNPLYQKGLSTQQSFITSWHMTGIGDAVNDKSVSFDYDNYYTTDVYNGVGETNDYTLSGGFALYAQQTEAIKRTGDNYVLKRIQSDDVTINFIKDTATRQDGLGPKALKEIQIYNKDSVLIKKFLFSYYYTTANDGCGPLGSESKRMILQSLQEVDYDESGSSVSTPPYYFNYDTTNKLPCRLSYAQDKWGYYNGKLTNSTMIPHNPYFQLYSYTGGANREVDSNYTRAGVLNEVIYPTGGKAMFEYESNKIDTFLCGGLRVRKITYHDSVAQSSMITEYTYPGSYYGWNPVFWYQVQHLSDFYIYNNLYSFTFTPLLRVESEPIAPNFFSQGAPGYYDRVDKKQKSTLGDLLTKHYFHGFSQPNESYQFGLGVPHPEVTEVSDVVENMTEYFKRESNGSYTLIQKDSSNYGALSNSTDYMWNAKGAWTWHQEEWCEWPGGDPFIYAVGYMPSNISPSMQFYKVYPYQIVKADNFTKQITAQGNLTQYSLNSFDQSNGNIKGTQTVDSKGDTTLVLIKYAADFLHTGAGSGVNYQIDLLLDNNFLAAPIEILTLLKKKDSTNSILLNATLFEYDALKVKKVYKVYDKMPFASFVEAYNNSTNFYKDSHYTLLQEVTAFDSEKNPRTVIVSDNKESYVWDGENMLAKTANATHEEMAFSSFETSQKGNWTYTGTIVDTPAITGKKAYVLTGNNVTISSISNIAYVVSYWSKNGAYNVNSTSSITGKTVNGWTYYEHAVTPTTGLVTVSGTGLIDELRLYPKGAQMTTFTHKDLRGVWSICDVSNRITYYEYGGGDQLKSIKDEDGNIVKRFEYKYKGAYTD